VTLRRVLAALGLAGGLGLVVGCGAGADDRAAGPSAAVAAMAPAASTTAAPATLPPPPTTAPAAALLPPVAEAPVATLAAAAAAADSVSVDALPRPIDAPLDEYGPEPELHLGRIRIPALGLDTVLYEGIRLTTLDKGPGHWPGSALPGQVGNVVVGGHRVTHTRPFRHLDRLAPGDLVEFEVDGGVFVYEVVASEVVDPVEGMRIVVQTPERTATLFACHPPGSAQYRWVVHLRLVEA